MDRADAERLDAVDGLAAFRAEFAGDLTGPIYLNGNSLGRPPKAVVAAVSAGVEDWARSLVGGWDRWIDLPMVVGDRLARLIGSGPGQVAVSDCTTVNLYKLASAALSLRPGRQVIVGDAADFPTDRYVLQGLAGATGFELRLIEGDPVDGLDLAAIAEAVDESTALVCLSHVNYRSGARLNVDAITELAHDRGALILWDLCHSAGAVPVGLDAAGVDLAVGCTYKYLNAGPGAPGFLYVKRALQDELRQPIWGWFGQQNQFAMGPRYVPQTGVARFLTGTPQILGLLAVDAAAQVSETAGIAALWAKSERLTAMLTDLARRQLEPLGAGLASPRDPARRGAHVSVSHPQAQVLCSTLVDRELVVGDFRRPDVIRLAPAPLYTRFVDVYDAVERIAALLASGRVGTGRPP
jgi:kynureninase